MNKKMDHDNNLQYANPFNTGSQHMLYIEELEQVWI